MKSWNSHQFSPHEQGTPYVTALRPPGRGGVPLADHINAVTAKNPGRWVLVRSDVGKPREQARPGVVLVHKTFDLVQTVDSMSYTRIYVRTYAHDGSNTDPLELKRQADSLPKPTFDVPLDDWVQRLNLPHVDMTDKGFEWTFEELKSATNIAMRSLHGKTPLKKLIAAETAKTRRTKQPNAVECSTPTGT